MTEEDLPARVVGCGVLADLVETQHPDVPGCAHLDIAHGEAQVVNVLDHLHPTLRRAWADIRWRQPVRCDQSAVVPELTFDERIATRYETYCRNCSSRPSSSPQSTSSPSSAGGGAALELGIGTGRVALPLSQRGVPVHGIELSPAMVAQLRAEAGRGRHRRDDRRLRDHHGWTGRSGSPTSCRNTIMNLTTQDEQVECFRNAAAHLEPGGCFVIEVDRAGAPAAPARRDRPPVHRDARRTSASTSTTSRTDRVLPPLLGGRRRCWRRSPRRFATCGRPSST